METCAKVFMILGTIIMAFSTLGISLFWCVPMTVHYFRNASWVSTGFKVCTMLLVSMLAGIIMLFDE